jgi:hypothetical protein
MRKKQRLEPVEYVEYCATRITSVYLGWRLRQNYLRLKALQVEDQLRFVDDLPGFHRVKDPSMASQHELEQQVDQKTFNARRIQRWWRSHRDRSIFSQIKHHLAHTLRPVNEVKGHPRKLMMLLNPMERQLLDDKVFDFHIRFRLDGCVFPPLVVYKVSLNRGAVDLNAFSPRPKYLVGKAGRIQRSQEQLDNVTVNETKLQRGWYERLDRNGWRPIHASPESFLSLDRPRSHHHSRPRRQQQAKQKRIERQNEWLQQL